MLPPPPLPQCHRNLSPLGFISYNRFVLSVNQAKCCGGREGALVRVCVETIKANGLKASAPPASA